MKHDPMTTTAVATTTWPPLLGARRPFVARGPEAGRKWSFPMSRGRIASLLLLTACAAEPHPQPPKRAAPPPLLVVPAPPMVMPDPCPRLEVALPELKRDVRDPPEVPAVRDAELLAPFFDKVARLLRGRASDHIRIAVYGDSNLTMDYMTGQMRRLLQLEHGDAGHGFIALGRPWSHYKHMDIRHDVLKGFESYACSTAPTLDRIYGISGIAAESAYSGAKTWVATASETAPIGKSASHFSLYYLKGKRKGAFDIFVDGNKYRTIDSRAESTALGIVDIAVDDGPHELMFEATDHRRRVRLLGLTLERGDPSFVVDSFGVGAMNTRAQASQHAGINLEMLRHRDYDLIVFATGANDVFTLDVTPKHMRDLIALHRSALPNVPILLLTPADRGRDRTFAPTLAAVEQRRVIARDNETALWDLWLAMGGANSMRSFKERGLCHADYIHFNEAGGAWTGERLVYALWRELKHHVEKHADAGCAASDDESPSATPTTIALPVATPTVVRPDP